MSAVVEFIGDAIEAVVDAVGDVVEAVGDVVEEVVEFVGDTVEAIIEDPLPTLLSIAGSFVGIPPPVTAAAITAARGGDLEDIVLSAGAAYIAPQATNALSNTLSSTIGSSIINETVSDIVVDGVSKGLVNGTIAEIRGGDFENGFAGAFTGSIVNSSVGEFTNEFISPTVQDMLADTGLETSTVNLLVKEGTKAVSSGLTAEITGRGDFQDAFVNSIQNSTINVGTNYAVNTIGDQFKTAEIGWQTVDQDSGKEDDRDLLSFDDYFALDTNRNTDTTGAGIPDDVVEEVQVADSSVDTGTVTETVTSNLEDDYLSSIAAGNFDQILGSADEVIQEFTEEQPTTQVAEATPTEYEEEIDLSDFDFDALPADIKELFDYTPIATTEEEPVGGLTAVAGLPDQATEGDVLFESGAATYAPEEGVVDSNLFAEPVKPTEKKDIYAGVGEETFGLPTDGTVDVAEADIAGPDVAGTESIIEGGLNKVQQSLVDATDPDKLKDRLVSGALNQVLRPAIRQGLTRAIKGTPTKQVAKRPQPKSGLSAQQLAQIRSAVSGQKQQPAQKIDMSKILAKAKTPPYVPPKKVDVSKLTPITNVASLTSILGGKG